MRNLTMLLALASLSACNQTSKDEAAIPAAPTYDGASVSNDAEQLKHGERLSYVLGCGGCHGASLQGDLFYEQPGFGAMYAPNLTLALQKYDAAGVEAALRTGRRPDGSELWGMPSEMYTHLGEADMTALVAYLKSLPPAGKVVPPNRIEAGWRAEVASGNFKSAAGYIAEEKNVAPAEAGPQHARGRMITMTACTECHGAKLEGNPGDTPDLDIAGAYSAEQFKTLMHTGVPPGGRKLRMMDGVARGRLSHMTDAEIGDLHAYLVARANRPQ